jgi:hypothetical protein
VSDVKPFADSFRYRECCSGYSLLTCAILALFFAFLPLLMKLPPRFRDNPDLQLFLLLVVYSLSKKSLHEKFYPTELVPASHRLFSFAFFDRVFHPVGSACPGG